MSKCRDTEVKVACYTDALGVKSEVFVHYVYGEDALGNTIIIKTVFTDANGVGIDTSAGTTSVGSCTYYTQLDSEYITDLSSVFSVVTGAKTAALVNESPANLLVTTNIGTQILPKNGTTRFSVDDGESDIVITGITLIDGTYSNELVIVNWGIRT